MSRFNGARYCLKFFTSVQLPKNSN
ncbi:hypothetical protein LCGC14_2752000, partial [marine sediment metagenome]